MAVLKNLVMRGASQRLGGMVLYQLKGQTLARELAPAVSNPRTPAQMDNRVRLQNVVSVYRANRGWMKGAFENKKEKESDYNAFVSANLSSSQVAFTKQQAAAGAAVAAPYQISSGSLGSIEQQISESELQTNIYLGTLTIDQATTVGEFAAAVIANNNNIVQGMQLSLILNIQQVNQATGIPYIITRAYEVILDAASTELLSAYYPDALLASGGGQDNILYADLADQGSGAASFILSHTVSAITRVSEQSLLQFGSLAVYNSYTSAAAIAEAVSSYGENQVNFLDSNSAGEQNDVPISQQISMAVYQGNIIRPNGSLTANITTSAIWRAFLSVPDTSITINNGVLTNLTDDETTSLTNFEVSTDGSSIGFKAASAITVSEPKQLRLSLSTSAGVLSMEFTLNPAS